MRQGLCARVGLCAALWLAGCATYHRQGLDPAIAPSIESRCPTNLFEANGAAHVRNVRLPTAWDPGAVPDTRHLLQSQATMDRINAYHPLPEWHVIIEENDETTNPETLCRPWAEDGWLSIKKHWVLELQQLIYAKRAFHRAN